MLEAHKKGTSWVIILVFISTYIAFCCISFCATGQKLPQGIKFHISDIIHYIPFKIHLTHQPAGTHYLFTVAMKKTRSRKETFL